MVNEGNVPGYVETQCATKEGKDGINKNRIYIQERKSEPNVICPYFKRSLFRGKPKCKVTDERCIYSVRVDSRSFGERIVEENMEFRRLLAEDDLHFRQSSEQRTIANKADAKYVTNPNEGDIPPIPH